MLSKVAAVGCGANVAVERDSIILYMVVLVVLRHGCVGVSVRLLLLDLAECILQRDLGVIVVA